MRNLRLLLLLGLALLATGCMGWVEGGSRPGSIHGHAQVNVGGTMFPLAGAGLTTAGATNSAAFTSRNGSFLLGRLFEGAHTVRLHALHGTYEQSVFVTGREQLPWTVKPSGISPELFYNLSGLKRLYIDDYGRQTSDYGTLVRWEKPLIHVFMDVSATPYGFDARWNDQYWVELRRWESYLGFRHAFVRTDNPSQANIIVQWVPSGALGEHAGIARQVAFYQNGSLKRVEIEIDVAYGGFPGLWEHELAHAMGVEHVPDPLSVMYPFLSHGQRTTLSPTEAAHVQLMYDIPSGQRLVGGGWPGIWQMASLDGGSQVGSDGLMSADNGDVFSVEADPVSGQREHVLRLAPDMMP